METTIKRKETRILRRIVNFTSTSLFVVIVGLIFYFLFIKSERYYYNSMIISNKLIFLAIYPVISYFIANIYESFRISTIRIFERIASAFLAVIIVNIMFYIITCIGMKRVVNILPLISTTIVQLCFIVLWSNVGFKIYFAMIPPKNTLIIRNDYSDLKGLIDQNNLSIRYKFRGTYTSEELLDNFETLSYDIQAIFLDGVSSNERNDILKLAVDKGIDTYTLPKIGDLLMSSAKPNHLFYLPMLIIRKYNPPISFLLVKRLVDISYLVLD